MTPQQFISKWTASTLKESSGAQQHFLDLCKLVGVPEPAAADPEGKWFAFERGAKKAGGGDGWADVWRKDHFAWEYKGKRKDLNAAYAQLQRYAPALDNPPLLVVSDMERIKIHTNFTNTVHNEHEILLRDIGSEENLRLLKWAFTDPDRLKPGTTKAEVTEDAARRFAFLAQVLRRRGTGPQRVAHFLNRILFCLFAQHAKLLPAKVVDQLLQAGLKRPDHSNRMLRALFKAMKEGGDFGHHVIEWFNGHLFDSEDTIPLEASDIKELLAVADLDWSSIEPSIFGTLFERGLDPDKRSQVGAHYTDPNSIMLLVNPVVVEPLTLKWAKVKREIGNIVAKAEKARDRSAGTRYRRQAQQTFNGFLKQLAEFRVLDPACGSGNFLYLALQALKDLEHRAILEAEELDIEPPLEGMHVGVQCVRGIEVNTYAAELARVTVWIGEIQWMLRHGMEPSKNPILKPLKKTIECRDAVIERDGTEPHWPQADVIIGNPPFLGNKRMLSELGDAYTKQLRSLFKGRLPAGVDLVTYWFEKARQQVEAGKAQRAGLVATQAIRNGTNSTVLNRIVSTAPIFEAWKDEPWVNDGAAVRVSLVAFGDGGKPRLDGKPVPGINADLTPTGLGANLTHARRLPENAQIAFQGPVKVGAFDIPGETARAWLVAPNPHGRPNSDVLRPWANGQDLTRRPSDTWIIDFADRSRDDAALYELPFQHVVKHVRAPRQVQRDQSRKARWWQHGRTGEDLRRAMRPLTRYIATPRLAKHRLFVWLPVSVLPDCQLLAIARSDDFTFGVLCSRFHTVWALANSSRHGDGNDGGRPRYNTAHCFEKFPFPLPDDSTRASVEIAARRLNDLRERWLNPTEWTERLPELESSYPMRVIAKRGHEDDLKRRTMTALYNSLPSWLAEAHRTLDGEVARAYGWADYTPEMPDDAIIARLLKMNGAKAPDLFTASDKHLRPVKTKVRKAPVAAAGTRRDKREAA